MNVPWTGDEPHRFRTLHGGRLLTAYNKGNPQYGDFFKAFPNIEPVHTLSACRSPPPALPTSTTTSRSSWGWAG